MKNEFKSSNPQATLCNTDISIIIPVLNEEGNLLELYDRLTKVLKTFKKLYEIIFIDDGSKDGSFDILKKLHKDVDTVEIETQIITLAVQRAWQKLGCRLVSCHA